ncbi:hypothetical protein F2Q68_00015493 [Brassica cretica]|uniref:Uncharacterized protein n=1 Tax=Brassica cretica TaxID=69181 RepID=A0A8S9HTQ8_BRACR|nr:hypothetical protein F2Q68_00015493 [Brassica cretica]
MHLGAKRSKAGGGKIGSWGAGSGLMGCVGIRSEAKTLSLKESDGDGDYLGFDEVTDWDPGIFGLTGSRRDLYHYDTSGAMGSINGEGRLGIFGGDKEIRGMMVDRRIWILSRSGVEIGLSANQLSDLGGNQEAFKDQRVYYGKGKGKMYEEPESKWVKVSTGRKKRTKYREREEPKEEGEIGVTERAPRNLHKVEKPQLALPESNGVKLAMSGARATAMDLEGDIGDSTEIESSVNGLEQAMDLVGNGIAVGDNVTLKPDESVVIEERKEELAEGVDDFQSLTDEETVKTDEDMRGVAEGEEELGGNGNQDVQAGGEEKKKGVRKILFKKPPGIAVGTSKMRLVQAVLSPRKNGASKSSKRQGGGGEGSKQAEDKVYAALGYYFQWNKPKIGYAFCFYIGIWDIGIGELLVMQWFTLRNKEKRCRLGLHRISQRFFRHNGVCGYQGFLASPINTKPPPFRFPSERLEAKPCRESPKIGSPSHRLFLSLPRRLSPLSHSSPRRLTPFSLFTAPPSLLSLLAASSREWWWWSCGVSDLNSHFSRLSSQIQIYAKVRCSTQISFMFFYIVECGSTID